MQAQKKATVTVAFLMRLRETDSGGDADRSRIVEKEIDPGTCDFSLTRTPSVVDV